MAKAQELWGLLRGDDVTPWEGYKIVSVVGSDHIGDRYGVAEADLIGAGHIRIKVTLREGLRVPGADLTSVKYSAVLSRDGELEKVEMTWNQKKQSRS